MSLVPATLHFAGRRFFLLRDVDLAQFFVASLRTRLRNGSAMVRAGGGNCSLSEARCGGLLRKIDFAEKQMKNSSENGKLVGGQQLLNQLFEQEARPSIRWLRQKTKERAIPYIRIGHLVFFDVDLVRSTLLSKNLVQGRHQGCRNPINSNSSPSLN